MGRPFRDLTGQIFNGIKVLKMAESERGAGKHIKWICECPQCHKEFQTGSQHIMAGEISLCKNCIKKLTNSEKQKYNNTREKLPLMCKRDGTELIGKNYDCYTVIDVKHWRGKQDIIAFVCECSICKSRINKLRSQLIDLQNECICGKSKGAIKISQYLKENNILFEQEKSFKDLTNYRQGKFEMRYDFYLPKYNCLIEFDGAQHFQSVEIWGGEEAFEKRKLYDTIKNEFALFHNMTLIRIRYNEDIEQRLNEEIVRLQEKELED